MKRFIVIFAILLGVLSPPAVRQADAKLTQTQRLQLARQFVTKLKTGFERVDMRLKTVSGEAVSDLSRFEEGALLLFEISLPGQIRINDTVSAEIVNGEIMISLSDFIRALDFPVYYDSEANVYDGWFIREVNTFSLDLNANTVTVRGDLNALPENAQTGSGDVLIDIGTIENWFDTQINTDVNEQVFVLEPEQPLPIMERRSRRKRKNYSRNIEPPSLPRRGDDYQLVDVPLADINNRVAYSKPNGREAVTTTSTNIRTAGELLYGTVTTNIGIAEDELQNVRATYLQESPEPELLGPLKARRFEAGDITTVNLPGTGTGGQEMGVRVTNADPLLTLTLPFTQISGYILPNWDVELYRNGSIVSFQETDANGFYNFQNVTLLGNRNFFKVVAYGPQGEVREEFINVPFDQNRRARGGSVYDVSLSLQDTQAYNKADTSDQDEKTPHFVGFYETPVGSKGALRVGLRSRQEEGEQKTYGNIGVSQAVGQTLLTGSLTADEEGAMRSDVALTKRFGPHDFRYGVNYNTDGFNPGNRGDTAAAIGTSLFLEGPFILPIGRGPRYSLQTSYTASEGNNSLNGLLNLNTTVKNLGLNQSFVYNTSNSENANTVLTGVTSVTGSYGYNALRLLSNYSIKPDFNIERLSASWQRSLTDRWNTQARVDRDIETGRNQYTAQVDWRPDFVTISPRVSVDDDGDLQASLNTRFGLNVRPDDLGIDLTRDTFTDSGVINAHVFLDKNGDGIFNDTDEPIEGARVITPQNTGRAELTDKNGKTVLFGMRPNVLTDVYIDQNSLEDPYWLAGKKGPSLMPKTGLNLDAPLPVYVSGEIDGTVYLSNKEGKKTAINGPRISLYNGSGEEAKTTTASGGGFYLFDMIMPGQYMIFVSDDTIPARIARPLPQMISIGYDGTIVYGNDITLQSGRNDVPSRVVSSLDAYKARHPYVKFGDRAPNTLLEIGRHKSRVSMALSWFASHLWYRDMIKDGEILVKPSKSSRDITDENHPLYIAFYDDTIDETYGRCRKIMRRGGSCEVVILPGAIRAYMNEDVALAN